MSIGKISFIWIKRYFIPFIFRPFHWGYISPMSTFYTFDIFDVSRNVVTFSFTDHSEISHSCESATKELNNSVAL